MDRYTLRLFDRNGRLARARVLAAETEDDALSEAAAERHLHAMEVWRGDQMIWRYDGF